jgi:hypothetical protein
MACWVCGEVECGGICRMQRKGSVESRQPATTSRVATCVCTGLTRRCSLKTPPAWMSAVAARGICVRYLLRCRRKRHRRVSVIVAISNPHQVVLAVFERLRP